MKHDQFLQEAIPGLLIMPSICIPKSSYFSILFYFSHSPSFPLSFSLSLPPSLTHTHTHTYTPGDSVVKSLPADVGDTGSILESGRSMEKEMTTHSSILSWRTPWMEEHGEVGCHALLQGIFPTQGSNPGLPHRRWILYCLSHQQCLRILE